MTTLKVNEIFYSLQGEGARSGEASIFIRLSGCNQSCKFCDTDWKAERKMSLQDIVKEIEQYRCKWIVWTGGEPTLQLTDFIIDYFHASGYQQAIETNGTNYISEKIDYVVCSPKEGIDYHQLNLISQKRKIDEFRLVFPFVINPHLLPLSTIKYISPLFDGNVNYKINKENVEDAVRFCMDNSEYRLSIQIHKLLNFR